MNEIKELLGRLDQADVPDVWPDASSRTVEPSPGLDRQPAARRSAMAAGALAILVSSAAIGFLVIAFTPNGPRAPVVPASPTPVLTSFDGWTVSVSIEPARVGPLAFSVGHITAARNGWIKHPFTVSNIGQQTVVLTDARTSVFLGAPRKSLLVSDWSCGYAFNPPNGPVQAGGCLSYLEYHRLKPDRSLSRPISILKNLRGMSSLTAGTYVFHQPVGYTIAGSDAPPHDITVLVTYTILRDPKTASYKGVPLIHETAQGTITSDNPIGTFTQPSGDPLITQQQAVAVADERIGGTPARIVTGYLDWQGATIWSGGPVWVVSFQGGDTCPPVHGPSSRRGSVVCAGAVENVILDATTGSWITTFYGSQPMGSPTTEQSLTQIFK